MRFFSFFEEYIFQCFKSHYEHAGFDSLESIHLNIYRHLARYAHISLEV